MNAACADRDPALGFISPAFLAALVERGAIARERWYEDALSSASDRLAAFAASGRAAQKQEPTPEDWRERILWSAMLEAVGANVIRAVSRVTGDHETKRALIAHGRDEARHARAYLDLLKVAATQPERRMLAGYVRGAAADFLTTYDGNLMQFIASTHVAEMRTFNYLSAELELHLSGAHPEPDLEEAVSSRSRYVEVLRQIIDDEVDHVRYTFEILSTHCEDAPVGELLTAAMFEYGRSFLPADEAPKWT